MLKFGDHCPRPVLHTLAANLVIRELQKILRPRLTGVSEMGGAWALALKDTSVGDFSVQGGLLDVANQQ